jgi:LCP family protein required for cell wall assembly
LELSGAAAAASTDTLAPTAAEAEQKTCGGAGVVDLLVLGLASPETPGQRGADAIRLVRIDFDRPGAAILALPPDLLVESVEPASLTQTYWLAQHHAAGADPERHLIATQALAQALLDSYGYAPDHYLTVNQPVFAEMVDALGGIVVDVPQAIQDVPDGWHTFQAGEQRLSGDQARDYVRLLNPSNQTYPSEWDRFARQNLVMQAALGAVLDPANWDQLPGLVDDFRQLLVTDLSAGQLVGLACMLEEVGGQARLLELPPEAANTDEQGRMIVDPDTVRSLINELSGE